MATNRDYTDDFKCDAVGYAKDHPDIDAIPDGGNIF